jgi:hypothetical protein
MPIKSLAYNLLPQGFTFLIYVFLLPFITVNLDESSAIQFALIVTAISFLNNGTFGGNQYLTFHTSRGELSSRKLLLPIAIGITTAVIILSLLLGEANDRTKGIFSLVCILIPFSNIARAIFEGQQRFFLSLSTKLIFNGLLISAISAILFLEIADSIFVCSYLVASIVIIIILWQFRENDRNTVSKAELGNKNKYPMFLMSFVLLFSFLYLDRITVFFMDKEQFAYDAILFEQLIKLSLPLNLLVMYVFPKVSAGERFKQIFYQLWFKWLLVVLASYLIFSPLLLWISHSITGFGYGRSHTSYFNSIGLVLFISVTMVAVQLSPLIVASSKKYFLKMFFPYVVIILLSTYFVESLMFRLLLQCFFCLCLLLNAYNGRLTGPNASSV